MNEAEEAGAAEPEARQVETGVGAFALVQFLPGERHRQEAERDVEPLDPLPCDSVGNAFRKLDI